MADTTTTTKKRGRGRPPKKATHGGKRPGAGRKKGVAVGQYKENPRNKGVTFMVSEKMLGQIRQLRELTKEDEINFNGMFVKWVDEYAQSYGIE